MKIDPRKIAAARDKWMKTEQGHDCRDRGILLSMSDARHLDNRLEKAFVAGANWAIQQAMKGKK